jgi:hypothetical protein
MQHKSLAVLEAEGRVLNSKNFEDLKSAILILNRVLETAMKQKLVEEALGVRITAEGIELVGVDVDDSIAPTFEIKAGERLGTALERRRTELDLDADDVAEKLPIRSSSYQRIESGLNDRPPDDVLDAIAEALDMDAGELRDLAKLDERKPVERFFF